MPLICFLLQLQEACLKEECMDIRALFPKPGLICKSPTSLRHTEANNLYCKRALLPRQRQTQAGSEITLSTLPASEEDPSLAPEPCQLLGELLCPLGRHSRIHMCPPLLDSYQNGSMSNGERVTMATGQINKLKWYYPPLLCDQMETVQLENEATYSFAVWSISHCEVFPHCFFNQFPPVNSKQHL